MTFQFLCPQGHLLEGDLHNHRVGVTGGVLADACGTLLRDFFRARRVRMPAE